VSRGFGVAAGLDPAVASPLAERCAELGYASLWSNDHPAANGLETLATFAETASGIELGVAVMALDRHSPAEIAAKVEQLGLDRDRLWIGVGAGFSERPLSRMREALPELREALPGVRLALAAMGPKMSALGGASYDGVFTNWMTPDAAANARERLHAAAGDPAVALAGKTPVDIDVQFALPIARIQLAHAGFGNDRQAELTGDFAGRLHGTGGIARV